MFNYKGYKFMLSIVMGLITLAIGLSLTLALRAPYYIAIIVSGVVFVLTYLSSDSVSKEMADYMEIIMKKSIYDMTRQALMEEDEMTFYYENEEKLFLLHNLLKSIARYVNRNIKDIFIEIYTNSFSTIYPDDEIMDEEYEYIEKELGDSSDRPKAMMLNRNVVVRISKYDFDNLVATIERGEGERASLQSLKEVRSLYSIIKAVVKAIIGTQYDGLTSYIAFKAIISLKKKGYIIIPENLMELLPLESKELKTKIKEQIKEEFGRIP